MTTRSILLFAALAACEPPPAPVPPPVTTYAGLDAYVCALAFQAPANVWNYTEEVSLCQRQCLQQFGLICLSCEGQVQNAGWSFCRGPIDSPIGDVQVAAWLQRLSTHPEIMAIQQVGIDLTIGVGLAHPEQVMVIGACDMVPDAALFNGVAGCGGKWVAMVCDTVAGPGVCPNVLPPAALTVLPEEGLGGDPPSESGLRAHVRDLVQSGQVRQPWDRVLGGREAFRKTVLEKAVGFERNR